jgi:peptidoglycan/xylan/chitin deacetylase (PgdA/CDA1 family)
MLMTLRLIKLLISCVVFCRDYVMRFFKGVRAPGTCVVINYHSLEEEHAPQFALQMDVLQRLARPISLSNTEKLDLGCHYVSITFDDAFRSFKKWAMPELQRRRVPVLVLVPTGYIGKKSAWFDYGGENAVGEEVMSAEELNEVADSEIVEIGSHSVTHPNLAQLSEDEARLELQESRKSLQLMLGKRIDSVSFPYGSFTERELTLAREAGYRFMFSIVPQMLVSKVESGLVGRINVQPTDWPLELRLKILGAYRWLPVASAWKEKVRKRGPLNATAESVV